MAALLGELDTVTSSSSPLLACGVCVCSVCCNDVRVCSWFVDARQKRVGIVDNDIVNAIQIAIAAIVAILLGLQL